MDIAAFAAGFNQFLRATNQGEGLRKSSDFLQPSLDIGKLLGAANRRYASGSLLNPATGGVAVSGPAISPATANEIWILRGFSVNVTTDATGVCNGAHLAFAPFGATNFMPISSSLNLGVNQRGTLALAYDDMVLMPGDQLIVRENNPTAHVNNVTFEYGVLFDVVKGP